MPVHDKFYLLPAETCVPKLYLYYHLYCIISCVPLLYS